MDRIQLLQERKEKLMQASKAVRDRIIALVDEKSFVELSAFSFSKNAFYGDEVAGEGVVTGFATVDGMPFYIVAQNAEAFAGGVSKANCDKIVKCIDAAEKNCTPIIYLLNSTGVQIGEGVTVLEGIAKLLSRANALKGSAPQFVVVDGELYGSTAALAAVADFTFFVKDKSVLAINSPAVLAAKSGKKLPKEKVGGADALDKTGLVSFCVDDVAAVREKVCYLTKLMQGVETDVDMNASLPALDAKADMADMLSVFDDYALPCESYCKEVQTVLGRIGGFPVAAVLFDGGDAGVELTPACMAKIKDFVAFAALQDMPLVTLVNAVGAKADMCVNDSRFLKEVVGYMDALQSLDTSKIAVVYKKAVGLGYTLFAAKSAGFDYTCAFANASIALFDDAQGALIEYADNKADKAEITARYAAEKSDPVNAAKDGYIDDIIRPQFVRQYIINALQMLA